MPKIAEGSIFLLLRGPDKWSERKRKKYILILTYLKATKKRTDVTYLNWKDRKTDSVAKPSKANDIKKFNF